MSQVGSAIFWNFAVRLKSAATLFWLVLALIIAPVVVVAFADGRSFPGVRWTIACVAMLWFLQVIARFVSSLHNPQYLRHRLAMFAIGFQMLTVATMVLLVFFIKPIFNKVETLDVGEKEILWLIYTLFIASSAVINIPLLYIVAARSDERQQDTEKEEGTGSPQNPVRG